MGWGCKAEAVCENSDCGYRGNWPIFMVICGEWWVVG